MNRATADIAIVGAGIAGLTTALCLARQDRPSVIYEKVRVLSEAGAGIQLSPNATRILIGLGLGRALARHVVAPEAIVVHSGRTGQPLARVPLGEAAEERYGAPYWTIHRADLQDVMVKAVTAHRNIVLKRGAGFTHMVEDEANSRITVSLDTLSGVETRNHDAVIGADGLWSKMRAALGDTSKPRYTGYRAYRAVVPRDLLPEPFRQTIVGAWVGKEGHVVHYPVITGFAVNIVVIIRDRSSAEGWGAPALGKDVTRHFGTWAKVVQDALEVPGEIWRSWALHDRTPGMFRGHGVATLIGDAAHPTLPFMAQGGAMGIEDADLLAEEYVSHPGRPDIAFRRFEGQRNARVARIQKAARKNASIFHMRGPLASARDLSLSLMPQSMLIRRYDWLYGK
ncbi:MAG: FAD-dependent monooxygenase [Rhodobiaceae bacterium]|nr:FAD-dependent monooxygenase [Rhodobiaceae bacterium]